MNEERVRRLADEAARTAPVSGDPQFAALQAAKAGAPALVRAPDGSSAFWIVPFVEESLARGIAQVSLAGRVTGVSVLGQPVARSWFQHAPEEAIAAIRAAFPDATLSPPVLSYDRAPSRWSWMVRLTAPGHPDRAAFIGFGGWHVTSIDAAADERER